jgi:glutamyl-tRNA reductase
VVSSTGAKQFVVTRDWAEPLIASRKNPLFIIDIAVPRDIDPTLHELENVFLYDIDDLKGIVDANLSLREQEARKVEAWIAEERKKFDEWVQTLGVIPLIAALREKALSIQEEAMLRIERKLPDLTEHEKRVIRKTTKSIVNQLLRDPIVRIKELAVSPQKEEALEMFVQLFALENQLKEEKEAEEELAPAKVAQSIVSISS